MALKVKRNTNEEDEKLLKEIDKVTKEKDNKKKDNKKKEEKKDNVQKESWWHGVKSEFKKVRWPSKKEMIKYSIATIAFIIFFALFFYLIEVIIYLINTR